MNWEEVKDRLDRKDPKARREAEESLEDKRSFYFDAEKKNWRAIDNQITDDPSISYHEPYT